MRVLIRDARVFEPGLIDRAADVLVEDGVIAGIGHGLGSAQAEQVDAAGALLTAGLMDMHVHLREPGQTHKEDIASGGRAALAGGFSEIVAMANTVPAIDEPYLLQRLRQVSAAVTPVRVHFVAAVTKGLQGTELTDFGLLQRAGAVAFSDDGRGLQSAEMMRRALLSACAADRTVVVHAEDDSLSAHGVMHRGRRAMELGLPGQSASAEAVMVARDVVLAEEIGARLHIQHVSCRASLEVLRAAKRRGVKVTAEATPHHLTLTEDVVDYDARAKMAPPLRSEDDRQALVEALSDGTIDAIATDHAPHSESEKALGMMQAPFGIVGLETAVGVVFGMLVSSSALSLERAVELLTSGPRACLGLPQVHLREGERADLSLIDRERTWTVDPRAFRSRSRNTPYGGYELRGQARGVVIDGRWYAHEGV